MFIRTFTAPNWPSDFAVSNHSPGDNCTEENYYDNHWDYMNRLPDYINSDTILIWYMMLVIGIFLLMANTKIIIM